MFILYLFSGVIITTLMACIGDIVVYNCTLEAMVHIWIISALDSNISISIEDMPGIFAGHFTIRIVAHDDNFIITSLSTIATSELNGTEISCVATSDHPLPSEIQMTTFVFLGMCILAIVSTARWISFTTYRL